VPSLVASALGINTYNICRGGLGSGRGRGRQVVDPYGLYWAEDMMASDWGIFLSAELQMVADGITFKSLAVAEKPATTPVLQL
jgi:hypothetical protein